MIHLTWISSNRFASCWIRGGFFSGLNSIVKDFQPSLLLYFKVLTHHYTPSACVRCWRADFWKKSKRKFRCQLVGSLMHYKVSSSSLRAGRSPVTKGHDFQQCIRRLRYYLRWRLSLLFLCLKSQQFFHGNTSPQAGELPGNLRWSQIMLDYPTSKSIAGLILIFPQKMWEMQKPHVGILHQAK